MTEIGNNVGIKYHNGQTGIGRKTCKFYKEILGHRPAPAPAFLLDSTEDASTRAEGDESETFKTILCI